MTKALTILTIASILFFVFLGGCSQTKLGKVDLSSGTPPNFLEMGKSARIAQQLNTLILMKTMSIYCLLKSALKKHIGWI